MMQIRLYEVEDCVLLTFRLQNLDSMSFNDLGFSWAFTRTYRRLFRVGPCHYL